MTKGVEDWINQAIPAGSGRYYALLHSDPELQERQKLTATLISVFSKLGFQSREIEVAKHKFEWWRNELEKESFQHPVMVALSDAQPPTHAIVRLQEVLAGYGMLLQNGSPSTEKENKRFHLSTGAGASHLLCEANTDSAVLASVGSTLSQFRCLRNLRLHVENGLLCIPMPALEAANLSPAQLTVGQSAKENDNSQVTDFLNSALKELAIEMQTAETAMLQHVSELQATERKNYKALYIYLLLQSQLLRMIIKDGGQLLEKEFRLTPIRNYWYAFRAARKFDTLQP